MAEKVTTAQINNKLLSLEQQIKTLRRSHSHNILSSMKEKIMNDLLRIGDSLDSIVREIDAQKVHKISPAGFEVRMDFPLTKRKTT